MQPLTFHQLPAACIVVRQNAWLFTADVRRKGALVAQRHGALALVTDFINDWQLRQAGPVYVQLGISQQFEALTYERALELERAELITDPATQQVAFKL